MNTILIPTDFSDTAKNATHYAIAFAKQVQVKNFLLLNVYQQPIDTTPTVADPLLETVEMYNINDFKDISETGLANFKQLIEEEAGENISIETISMFSSLDDAIKEVCTSRQVDLVIMGITGGSGTAEVLIGSNAVTVAKHVDVPLLVVPAQAIYVPVKEVALALDFKKGLIAKSIAPLKILLDETKAKLFLLHVNQTDKKPNDDASVAATDDLLHDYNPEFKVLEGDNFMDTINKFASENQVDIIAAISRKHNWFENLFRRSHTKMMAFHSHVPLMILHE